MAEIGAALREARTRARIEIAQMEAQTKIRAKYLRALENEEWELLPGPTYVKSFLKTYGDMLGIDGRQLVADYKREHEPFQVEGDIGQLSKHSGGRMNRSQGRPPLVRTVGLALLAAVVVGGGAWAFVTRGDDDPSQGANPTPLVEVPPTSAPDDSGDPAAPAKKASVSVVATGDVRVCMRVGRKVIVKERELRAGERTKSASGRTVIVTVTSASRALRLRVNGRTRKLPAAPAGPLTVSVTATGVKRAGATVTACRV